MVEGALCAQGAAPEIKIGDHDQGTDACQQDRRYFAALPGFWFYGGSGADRIARGTRLAAPPDAFPDVTPVQVNHLYQSPGTGSRGCEKLGDASRSESVLAGPPKVEKSVLIVAVRPVLRRHVYFKDDGGHLLRPSSGGRETRRSQRPAFPRDTANRSSSGERRQSSARYSQWYALETMGRRQAFRDGFAHRFQDWGVRDPADSARRRRHDPGVRTVHRCRSTPPADRGLGYKR